MKFKLTKKKIALFVQVLLLGGLVLFFSAYLLSAKSVSGARIIIDGDPDPGSAPCASLNFRAIPSSIPANSPTPVQFIWTQRRASLLTDATITNLSTGLDVWKWPSGGSPFTSSPTVTVNIGANTVFELNVAGNCTETTPIDVVVLATAPVCGNGIREGVEACDKGALNGTCPASCSMSCRVNTCSGQFDQASGTISVRATNPGAYSIPILVTGRDSATGIITSTSSLTMTVNVSSSLVCTVAVNPPPQTLTVTNSGGGTLNWTAAGNRPWLSVSPASGSLGAGVSAPITVSFNQAGMTRGTYSGAITISGNAPSQSVPVTFTIP